MLFFNYCFQILGMTASLYFGQASSNTQAEKNVMTLCTNLDAEIISTVQDKECLEELAVYQHIPDEGKTVAEFIYFARN